MPLIFSDMMGNFIDESDERFGRTLAALAKSPFRSGFHLRGKDYTYLQEKGLGSVLIHAEDFINKRLAPAEISNDGKQTPMRGHPVFVAQHATACCCRGCLQKWHRIPPGRELTLEEQAYVVVVLERWLRQEVKKQGDF